MERAQLVIKHLSTSGEVLKTIACAPGQVTVFRAPNPNDLKPYQRALSGLPGAERFSISLGNETFHPFEHTLIGFGEQFPDKTAKVSAILEALAMPDEALQSTLISYGLERAVTLTCEQLSSGESRMLRLLAATFGTETVLVLNDPFEPLESHWRERYAELVLNFARRKKSVVVVTALSNRPESWIDNDLIVRAVVGETRQKTIGFSSAPSEIKATVEKLRAEMRSTTHHTPGLLTGVAAVVPQSVSGISKTSDHPITDESTSAPVLGGISSSYFKALIATPIKMSHSLLLTGIVLGGAALYNRSTLTSVMVETPTEVTETTHGESAALLSESGEPVQEKQVENNIPGTAHNEFTEAATFNTAPVEPQPQILFLLDEYPPAIKSSLLKTYEGNNPDVPLETGDGSVSAAAPALVKTLGKSSDLLEMLERASDSTNAPSTTQVAPAETENFHPKMNESTNDEASWEQRRELMRQRFLESIQAASSE